MEELMTSFEEIQKGRKLILAVRAYFEHTKSDLAKIEDIYYYIKKFELIFGLEFTFEYFLGELDRYVKASIFEIIPSVDSNGENFTVLIRISDVHRITLYRDCGKMVNLELMLEKFVESALKRDGVEDYIQ